MKVSAPHRGWTSGRATPSLRPTPYAAETANPAGRHLSFAEICPDNRSQLFVRGFQRSMGNVSFGSIARILGVSGVAVLNWVRDEARKLPQPSTKAEVVVVTLDEMWHFVQKRLRNCGFGEPMTLLLGEPSPGFLVAVMTPHAKSSSTKSVSKARRSSPMIGRAITASSLMTNSSPAKT